jgi:hypothetical protein
MAGVPTEWPWGKTEHSRRVKVEDIRRDDRLQPRTKLNEATARRYATAMDTGAKFPPIKLAQIEGHLYVYCGWHRLEAAAQFLRHSHVEAEVREMTLKEASWEAAADNLQNGTPYTHSDMRRVLGMYVAGGQHREGRGIKSLRDMARELTIKKSTLHRWLCEDHGSVARAMSKDEGGNPEAMQPDPEEVESLLMEQVGRCLADAEALYGQLKTPEGRYGALEGLEAALERMRKKPHTEPTYGL